MGHGDWKDMFRAVQENDIELVTFYIRKGIDINYQHPEYLTSPLIESIRCNHMDMMQLLLNSDALVELKEAESGKNALQIARDIDNNLAVSILEVNSKNSL